MAAAATFAFAGFALWTVVSFVVAVAVGRTLRRLQPIPVRTGARRTVKLRDPR